jgi:hypothetical protein
MSERESVCVCVSSPPLVRICDVGLTMHECERESECVCVCPALR